MGICILTKLVLKERGIKMKSQETKKIQTKITVKEIIECYKNQELFCEGYIISDKLFNNNAEYVPVCVQHVPNKLNSLGLIISGAILGDDGQYYIWTDDRFKMLPDFVQNYIIYHELGHLRQIIAENIKFTKFDNILRSIGISKKCIEYEVFADSFATTFYGQKETERAMEWLMENVDLSNIMVREYRKRLQAVRMSA